MKYPDKVNILGIEYSIEYVDKPSEVDIYKRVSLWGQIDFWTHSIRIYDNSLSKEHIWNTIIHEVIHGIAEALNLKVINAQAQHDELDILALALTDVLFRNGWMK